MDSHKGRRYKHSISKSGTDKNPEKKQKVPITGGKCFLHGFNYELKLTTWLLIRRTLKRHAFQISKEVQEAGKFDDIVYEDIDNQGRHHFWFIQAKHKVDESKKITFGDLVTDDEKGEFQFQKYFKSYLAIEERFSGMIECLILCTNIDFDDKIEDHIKLRSLTNGIELLNYGNLLPKHKNRKHLQIEELPDQLKEKAQLCSEVYQLAQKLASDILHGNKLELRHELLKKYQHAIVNYILSPKADKKMSTEWKICANFADNMHLTPRTQTFHAAFLKVGKELMKKVNKTTKNLPTDKEFWNHISKRTVHLSATFSQTRDDVDVTDLPNDEITEAQMKAFCQKFVFAVNEPNEKELKLIIKDYLEENYNKIIPDSLFTNEFFQQIWQWMSNSDSKTTFTNRDKDMLMKYLKDNWDKLSVIGNRSDNPEKLLQKGNFFHDTSILDEVFKYKNSLRNFVCLTCTNGTSLTYIKIAQYLETCLGLGMCAILNLKQAIALQKNLSKTLDSEKRFILVIEIDANADCNEVALQFLSNLTLKVEQIVILIISQKISRFKKILQKLQAKIAAVHHDSNDFMNITNGAKDRMLSQEFNFQDVKTCLKELPTFMSENLLCKIIDNIPIKIGRNPEFGLHATTPHYLERTFQCHSEINEEDVIDHFNSNYGLFIGNVASKNILPKQLSDSEVANIDNFKVQTTYATERYDADAHRVAVSSESIFTIYDIFKNIAQRFPEKKFRFLEMKDKNWSEIISEEAIENKSFANKLIVISGEPGMGKSKVLMHIAGRIKHNYPLKWVIIVNLADYSSKLKVLSKDIDKIDLDSVIGFLSVAESHSDKADRDLAESILNLRIRKSGEIIVLFDGFDEIMPYYGNAVRKMIHLMRDSRIEQIWMTTRPNYHARFEAVSLNLLPFSKDQQADYLKKYWSNSSKNPNDTTCYRISQFASILVLDLYISTNKEIAQLMGNALHIQLVAEAFKEECFRYLISTCEVLDYEKSINLKDLYTKFVKQKYTIWLNDKMSCDLSKACVKNELKSKHRTGRVTHQFYATLELFPKTNTQLQILVNHCKVEKKLTKEELCTIGLMSKFGSGKIRFIHRTFAEFYIADLLAIGLGLNSVDAVDGQLYNDDSDYDDSDMVHSEESNDVCSRTALEFLRPEYFNESHKMLRHFLDQMILLNMPVHQDFIVGHSSSIDQRLLKFSKDPASMREQDPLGRTPFHLACLSDVNLDQIKRMLQMDVTLLSLTDSLHFGPISYAVASNRDRRLEVIIELLKSGSKDENFKKTLKYFMENINDFMADFDDEYYDNLTRAINNLNLFEAILAGNDHYVEMFVETFHEKLNRKRMPAIFFVVDVVQQHEMLVAINYEIINFFMLNHKGPSLGTIKDSILKHGEENNMIIIKQIKNDISKLPAFHNYFSNSLNPLHLNAISTLVSLSCKSARQEVYQSQSADFFNEIMTNNIHFIVFDLLEIFGQEIFEKSIQINYFIDFFRDVSISKAVSHAGTPNLDLTEGLLQDLVDNLSNDDAFMCHFPPGENSFEASIKYFKEQSVSNLRDLRLKLHDLWEEHKEDRWQDFYTKMYSRRPIM